MGKELFRKENPERTYKGPELKPYGKYKSKLVEDFNGRCGYTDCNHLWFGGRRNFHIDHFKPKSKYPHLETKYSNLVYSCSSDSSSDKSSGSSPLHVPATTEKTTLRLR